MVKYKANEIATVIEKVNTYAVDHVSITEFGWKDSVYHLGNMIAYLATGNETYYKTALNHADKHGWYVNYGNNTVNGDNYCLSQTYLLLNALQPADYKIKDVIRNAQFNLKKGMLDYSWVDAIFMSAGVFDMLTAQTGEECYADISYTTYLDARSKLFDQEDALWYRDGNFVWKSGKWSVNKNGKKVYWSRGNAWAFAALAMMLERSPKDSARYATYYADYCAMAKSVMACQREDGFWNVNLADADEFGGNETTGTAGFSFGYAMGLRLGLLDWETYFPVLEKSFDGLLELAVRQDGRVLYAQPEAFAPFNYEYLTKNEKKRINTTVNFAVGLFLMAASAVLQLCPDYVTPVYKLPDYTYDPSSYLYQMDETYYKGNVSIVEKLAHQADNGPENLFNDLWGDEFTGSRWAATGYPQEMTAKLEQELTIQRIRLVPYEARPYNYTIEVSLDGITYDLLVDANQEHKVAPFYEHAFTPTAVRYLKLRVFGCKGGYGGEWINIKKLLLYENL